MIFENIVLRKKLLGEGGRELDCCNFRAFVAPLGTLLIIQAHEGHGEFRCLGLE